MTQLCEATCHAHQRFYRIALIPGDGIGKEVIPAAVKVLQAAASSLGDRFSVSFDEFEWGCEYYLRTGRMMPEDGLERPVPSTPFFWARSGSRPAPDHISWRHSCGMRNGFDQYVNIRPAVIFAGVDCPSKKRRRAFRLSPSGKTPKANTPTSAAQRGTPFETACRVNFQRKGAERIIRFAFETARNAIGSA